MRLRRDQRTGARPVLRTAGLLGGVVAAAAVLAVPANLTAQEGDFSGGFSADDEQEATDDEEPAGEASQEDEFSGGFGSEGDDASGGFGGGFSSDRDDPLSWSGRLRVDTRGYADYDEPVESAINLTAVARLELEYAGANSEVIVRTDLSEDSGVNGGEGSPGGEAGGDATRDAADQLQDRVTVDEAYLRVFYDHFDLQAGYIRTVWGKGDEVHVVDFLNSTDYRDFINTSYTDRRRATGMLKVDIPWVTEGGASGRVELAYAPVLRGDLLPESGPWVTAQAAQLEGLLTGYGGALATARAAQTGAPEAPGDAMAPETQLWAGATAAEALRTEATDTLEFGQAGARATAQLRGVDLGAVYYWGYRKSPSPRIRLADEEAFSAFAEDPAAADPAPDPQGEVLLTYDRLQGFGLEAATVVGPFNLRAEGAYYLTEDIAGDDPEVPNNSLEYLAGFDVDLGISSLNLNVQGTGSYILNSAKIDEAGAITGVSADLEDAAESDQQLAAALDASPLAALYYDPNARLNYQYDPDGIYTTHIVSAALTDSWRNDRIRPEVTGAVSVERQDYRIAPAVEFVLRDDMLFEVSGALFGGDEAGTFGQFDDNDYLQLRFEYNF